MSVKPDIPAPKPIRPNGQKQNAQGPAYDPGQLFILEFATLLAIRDSDTVATLGRDLSVLLMGIIRDPTHVHPLTLSRAVYYMLMLLRVSHEHDFVRAPVLLHALSKFDDPQVKYAATFTINGLLACLAGPSSLRNEIVNSPDFWFVLQALHANPETAQQVFEILEDVVSGSPSSLTADNFDPVASLLNEFATAPGVVARSDRRREQDAARNRQPRPTPELQPEAVARGVKAMQIVNRISTRVPQFISQSQLEQPAAWRTYWSPPFRTLQKHASNPARAVRAQALDSLRSVLLSPALSAAGDLKPEDASMLFESVLFPLIAQLLRPEVWHSDPGGMGDTRLQAALLMCKVFLRFLEQLVVVPSSSSGSGTASTATTLAPESASSTPTPDAAPPSPSSDPSALLASSIPNAPPALGVWTRILELLERLFKSGASSSGTPASNKGASEALEEAVPEGVKNVLLVMRAEGLLVRPEESVRDEDEEKWRRALWEGSRVRLERFLPGLLEDVVPPAVPEASEAETEVVEEKVPQNTEEGGKGGAEDDVD